MARTRRIRRKQKGGGLTYEQEQYLKEQAARRKRNTELRTLIGSPNLVIRQEPLPPGQQWQRTLAAGLPNKRGTGKRKRKN